MDYNKDKVDEFTLALLFLVMETDKVGTRAWKGFNWSTMNRLHDKGYISNPVKKNKSVVVTPEGLQLAKELFLKHFGKSGGSG